MSVNMEKVKKYLCFPWRTECQNRGKVTDSTSRNIRLFICESDGLCGGNLCRWCLWYYEHLGVRHFLVPRRKRTAKGKVMTRRRVVMT